MFAIQFLCFVVLLHTGGVLGYQYAIKEFTVPVDHFSFAVNETFNIRYLINDTYWDKSRGPIFFYTGNEGDIELFANNTGFMWEIAPKFKALLLFAEHRYYGKSLPFGNQSFSDPKYSGYLTSQQALADYVDLLIYFNGNESKSYKNPVIAFGGSYGGMLAAYIRMKYPHIVLGAVAASAPILQFSGLVPCDIFLRITTSDFKAENVSCSQNIRKSWDTINKITAKEDGLKWLSAEWKLCHPLQNASQVKDLKDWLNNVYGNLAMANYPYPANFLEKLPAYPIREVCKHLQNTSAVDKDLLKDLFNGISVYFNYTGKAKCLNIESSASSSLGDLGWNYQSCTEMVMPMCSNGNSDMFEPEAWNFTKFAADCQKQFHVTPQPFLAEKIYGGKRIDAASNIIFSNGLLDPWSGGGVLSTSSKKITIVMIPEGAHHLDLRESNANDPPSVVQCRLEYQKIIKQWIKEYEQKYLSPRPPYFDIFF